MPSEYLNRHVRPHEGERLHEPNVKPKSGYLLGHVMTHPGEKIFA